MKWRRHRGSRPRLDPREQADTWQLVSLLLDYPTAGLLADVPTLRAVADRLPDPVRAPLVQHLDHLVAAPLAQRQADYVDTFDTSRKRALHLSYFTHGDTRRRGVALVEFRQTYRRAGVQVTDEQAELPDHLCLVLEFGALHDSAAAWKLLNDHRVGIELLRTGLADRGSPWLGVVEALRATLPRLEGDDEQALARLIAEGPPSEEVGLDGATAPYSLDPAAASSSPARSVSDLGATIPVGAPR